MPSAEWKLRVLRAGLSEVGSVMGEASWVLGIRAGALQLGLISVAPAELVGALGEEKGVGRGFKVPNVASLQGRGGVALNGFLVSLRRPCLQREGLVLP